MQRTKQNQRSQRVCYTSGTSEAEGEEEIIVIVEQKKSNALLQLDNRHRGTPGLESNTVCPRPLSSRQQLFSPPAFCRQRHHPFA